MSFIELEHVSKSYGYFEALSDVSMAVDSGQVVCVLGDNGAGKSTLIKILAGVHKPTSGTLLIDGSPTVFNSPREAHEAGISTVYQNLAIVDQMSVWRNFFLGQELTGSGLSRGFLRAGEMRSIAAAALESMGVTVRSVDVDVEKLSGGQRQSIAIARAVHFGARVLILDEPTAALGVKQSQAVLDIVREARSRGLAVILITHNPAHAYAVGDQFVLLSLGQVARQVGHDEISLEELTAHMAGL
ncbi:MAG: ATP-binding cassette domain-containing protein [Corynebacterium sp.]|nr:ATP-binding cassette domain-containing protein [Corynebacterium sp.]